MEEQKKMKLVYARWKHVRAFLKGIDEPLSSFTMTIRRIWQKCPGEPSAGRWIYEVEIPKKYINGSLEDSRTE